MKKLVLFLPLLLASPLRAEVVKYVYDPLLSSKLTPITVLSTNTIQAGTGITTSTNSTGIVINATGGGGSGSSIYPASSTAFFPFGEKNSTSSWTGTGSAITSVVNSSGEFSGPGSGNWNELFGTQAGFSITSGAQNCIFGNMAGDAITTGSSDTIMGYNAGTQFTTENQSSIFGSWASTSSLTASRIDAFGFQALQSNFGSDNNAFGNVALTKNTSGIDNCAFGNSALTANTSGIENSAMGYQSLVANTTGQLNTAVGYLSIVDNIDGNFNTAIGWESGEFNQHGSSNTFLGAFSGPPNVTALYNVTTIGANTQVQENNAVIIGSAAYVGIGTQSPATLLHVSSGVLTLDGTGAGINLLGNLTGTFMVPSTAIASGSLGPSVVASSFPAQHLITPGYYTIVNATVNQQGLITSIASGTASGGITPNATYYVNIGTATAGQYSSLKSSDTYGSVTSTINFQNSNVHYLQLTGNTIITLQNPLDGGRYLIELKQMGSGSYTVTWPNTVLWPAGTAPTLTTTVKKVDIIALTYDGGNGVYYADSTLNH